MANQQETLARIREAIEAMDVNLTEAAGVAEQLREHTHTCTHTCTGASCMCARGALDENIINPETPGAARRRG